MSNLVLRPYQQECVDALWEYMYRRPGNPLAILPTGAGKSVCQASFINRAVTEFPGTRIMCATHVAELIKQNFDELHRFFPETAKQAGIYSAGLGKRDLKSNVLFAGVQSIYKKADYLDKFDMLLVDECHLIPKKGDGMYLRLIEDLTANNRDLRVLGWTATPYRLDSGLLTQKPNNIFSSVCYDADIIRLIDEGYLCPLVPHIGKVEYDTSGVSVRGGEFAAPELNRVLEESEKVTQEAVKEIVKEGRARKAWLVFCGSVKQAKFVTELLSSAGVSVELVTGDTDKWKRKRVVERFKDGLVRCLVNVGVFTTGFNAPILDMIAVLRPTHSPGLHCQILGRGMRIHPDKSECVVLDFGGNVMRHGPINRVHVPTRTGKTGEAPVKMCPECNFDGIHASCLVCPECGYEFPPREVKIGGRSLLDIISRKFRQRVPISSIEYSLHQKKKPGGVSRTLRVDYYAGMNRIVSEFVCVEHDGYAGKKALNWLKARLPEDEMELLFPLTVDSVLDVQDKIKAPRDVQIDTSEKHPKLVTHFF